VLAPKLTTQISKIAYPTGPRRTLNASAVNLTPSTPGPMFNQTHEIIINKAVDVHMIKVSKIGPSIATKPCLTGLDVLAAP